MSEAHVERTISADKDPYELDPANIQEPPTTFKGSLRFLGPGMITSAAVVGSGELLTATTLGAKAGFMLLWLVFVSTFVKVWVQIELGRWSISTGKPAITGYNETVPKIAGHGWMAWLVLFMFLQFLIGQAGVISASAFAFSSLLPFGSDPYSTMSIGIWVAILAIIAILVHWFNRYDVLENLATILVMLVTAFAVVVVFLLQGTEFAWSMGDFADGMQFKIAAGSVGVAISMFGMTGVGAGEITAYTYWVVEKGYAAWTGPNDGSEGWVRRAKGWIKVMKIDAWVSWVVYTISTAAFYILGAAVLHPQGLVPEGNDVMTTISSIFDSAVGKWGGTVFLIGAGVALFKTILANVPSLGRQVVNTFAAFNLFDWKHKETRDKWMRITMVVLPIVWGVTGTVVKSPLQLVIIAGILNAVFLMGVAVTTLYLQKTQTDNRVKDGNAFQIILVVSAIAIFAVGCFGLYDQIVKIFG